MSDPFVIKRGMRIVFKPEYRDPGDAKYTLIAADVLHPVDGGFGVSTIENGESRIVLP